PAAPAVPTTGALRCEMAAMLLLPVSWPVARAPVCEQPPPGRAPRAGEREGAARYKPPPGEVTRPRGMTSSASPGGIVPASAGCPLPYTRPLETGPPACRDQVRRAGGLTPP